jgi:hypothetical protein
MTKNRFDPPAELDISWRTRELGPEMRRALFKKVAPMVKLASERDGPRAQGQQEGQRTATPEHGGRDAERHDQPGRGGERG